MHLCQLDRKPDSWFVRYRTLAEIGNIFYTHHVTGSDSGPQVHIACDRQVRRGRWLALLAELFQ
jgi:hypothetical protein